MSETSSTSMGSSSSTPTIVETPENQIIDQISAYAQQLAGQMYQWAQGVFAQTSQITNQAVGNFFNVSQNMLGLSNNLTSQYNNLFAPENAQLVADANSYASPARLAVDMGQAGATQAQAGDQALKNSEEALRSYGINPSDGRYAALDHAAAVQNAANVAGAENTQRNSDIATGQKLRSEAVQVGAQLPASIANINNTAIQANTGASNASLANANTGVNLMGLPDKYLGTAMGVKLPPVGQNSQSQTTGRSSGSGPGSGSKSGGSGNPSGNGSGGNDKGAGAWGMNNPNYGAGNTATGFSPTGFGAGDYGFNSPLNGIDPNSFDGTDWSGGNAPFQDYGSGSGQTSDPYGAGAFGSDFGQDFNGGGGNTFDPTGQGYDTFGGGTAASNDFGGTGFGDYGSSYDPSANTAQDGWGDPSNYSASPGDTIDYNSSTDYSGMSSGSGSSADYSQGDTEYAQGGAIPPQASPSGGQQVDDIPAQGPGGQPMHMNANEFVIPQDVALWKGQEFFQKLIDGSRKSRMMAPAKPQATPARNMR